MNADTTDGVKKHHGGNTEEDLSPALKKLTERYGSDILDVFSRCGDDTVVVKVEKVAEISRFLKEHRELDFDMLVDITAVDYLPREPRFEVVYHYLSLRKLHRVRIKVLVSEKGVEVPTLTRLWGAADWLEREVWDMFGIRFKGHPDLSRILMYEEFEGHPLRKDYPIRKRQPLYEPEEP